MKRAFTILELLAATALTALLMVVVLRIIGSIGLTHAGMARQRDGGAWRADLFDTLRHDLTNSTAASFQADALTLEGHGALDRATLSHVHAPVTVTYGLATVEGRRWLVRTQMPRAGISNEPAWSEYLCPGVTGFSIRPANGVLLTPNQGDQGTAVTETIPPIVSVMIDGPEGIIVNETLVLR